jgi:hypothetical protein
MQEKITRPLVFAAFATLLITGAGCAHTKPLVVAGPETFAGASDQGGQVIVNAIQTTNTVLAVAAKNRRVTLKNKATGVVRQYLAGPGVLNFNLIRPGDVVNATVVEKVSIFEALAILIEKS